MHNARKGRADGARVTAPSFAPSFEDARDLARDEQPSRADSSHVARRRASSAPAHEVTLEELELFDAPPPPASDAMPSALPASMPPLPTSEPATASERIEVSGACESPGEPTSVAPLAMDVTSAPIDVPIAKGPLERPRRRIGAATMISLLALGVAVAALVKRVPQLDMTTPATLVSNVATSEPPHGAAAGRTRIPEVDVATLPRAREGTVLGLPDHRLWIDGHLAPTFRALVDCGEHIVQVGSAGLPRTVDVPCGDEVVVSP